MNNPPRLIGIAANGSRAGKTTAADVLVNEYGYTRVKFAGVLKEMAKLFLEPFAEALTTKEYTQNLTNAWVESEDKDKPIPGFDGTTTPRDIMVTLGTQWGRQYVNPDVWVLVAGKQIMNVLKAGGKVVVDDMRFPNELQAVIKAGGKTLFINRPGFTQGGVCEGLIKPEQCDAAYDNASTIENLQWRVRTFLEKSL